MMPYRTIRGCDFGEVASAMQKAIRRGDARLAGYWALELFESGYHGYVWRRLLTISAEDCWGILTQEIAALHAAFHQVNRSRSKNARTEGRIFIAKAVILLAMAKKSRDADHLANMVYDAGGMDAATLVRDIEEARHSPEKIEIPDYALDVHTWRGRKRGRTRREFFIEEFDALRLREPGLFDHDLERLRVRGERSGPGEGQQSMDAGPQRNTLVPTPQEEGRVGREGAAKDSGTTRRHTGTRGRIRYVDPKREDFTGSGWEMRGLTSSGKQIWVRRG